MANPGKASLTAHFCHRFAMNRMFKEVCSTNVAFIPTGHYPDFANAPLAESLTGQAFAEVQEICALQD